MAGNTASAGAPTTGRELLSTSGAKASSPSPKGRTVKTATPSESQRRAASSSWAGVAARVQPVVRL
jgi:hypothetical protein